MYEDLYYQGFDLNCREDITLADVVPQSEPSYVAGGPLVAGTIESGERLSLTVNYKDSVTECFDIRSLYFAGLLPDKNTIVTLPESISVTLTGFDVGGAAVANQTERYVFSLMELNAAMQPVKYDESFSNLASLEVAIGSVESEAPALLLTVTLDTIEYTVHGIESGWCSSS